MPKEIINITIDRPNTNVPWGFVITGGKDQSLTVKIGKVKPYSPAEHAGLKSVDYVRDHHMFSRILNFLFLLLLWEMFFSFFMKINSYISFL